MKFNKEKYTNEMKGMVDKAFSRLRAERPEFEIYSINIWTDVNSAASSVNFESQGNSDKKVAQANEWSKKHQEQCIADGDQEQANLFEPIARNCNPADFELPGYEELSNAALPLNWEEKSKGGCWDILEPALQEIGQYAFGKINELKVHSDFELSVNGRLDWYQFAWSIK